MPRPRALLFAVLAIVAIILFARSTSSSDKSFYENTVQRLQQKHDEERQARMGTQAVHDAKLREAAKNIQAEVNVAAEERRKKDGDDDGDSLGASGHKQEHVGKPKPDDAQKVMGGADEAGKEGKPHEVGSSRGKWTNDDAVAGGSAAAAEEKNKKPAQTDEERRIDATLTDILKRSPIIIFSKTYCPFSKKAKDIFFKYDITPKPHIVEIDRHELGPQLQDKLLETTGRRTVPNILISGKSIGGGDDVEALHNAGELIEKIKTMGGKRIIQAELKKH